jgi:hypothetical protein
MWCCWISPGHNPASILGYLTYLTSPYYAVRPIHVRLIGRAALKRGR